MESSRKKILVLSSRVPFPLEKGDKLRIYHQIKQLSKKNEVHLCALSNSPLHPDAEAELKKFCVTVNVYESKFLSVFMNLIVSWLSGLPFQVGYFFNSGAHYFVKKLIEDLKPDHIYVQLVRMAEYVKDYKDIPKSIDYMDSFSLGMKRRKEKEKNPIKKLLFGMENARLKNYEEKIFSSFNFHTIISDQDKASFDFPDAKTIEVIPNGVDQEFFKADEAQEKKYDLLFTGNMSYPPNVAAANYIVNEILPIVKKEIPTASVMIAGANPSSSVKALKSDQVTISGWIDDIRDAYNAGKICITPLMIGTGLQNKLLEAMSMGLPCISSALANNALGAKDGEEILIGDTPEKYAKLVINLLKNEEKAKELGENGRLFVKRNYDWQAVSNRLHELIQEN